VSDKARFAKNLRLLREAADLTQAELADAVGKSRGSVVAWEDEDRPTMPSETDLETVARRLKTTKAELRYGDVMNRAPMMVRDGGPATSLPRRLEIMALDFEKWAIEQGADRAFMRYVRSSLREPDFVALFAGGPDESMMNPEQAENEMRAHIDELKTMLRRRLKRSAAISGKLAPKEDE
jgi:transcriptional regulator with XRE-family HTH domain